MGRKSRSEKQGSVRHRLSARATGSYMPSRERKWTGDILRRDDAMKLEKPRGKFDVWFERILGSRDGQL